MKFQVQQIDHTEVFVPDRYEAAEWYERTLGMTVALEHEHWASEPDGPLMISSDGGNTMIALFVGVPLGREKERGIYRIAFRVDCAGFIKFLIHGPSAGVYNRKGEKLEKLKVVDHDKAWSVYFTDPWGNKLEVTSYDYDVIKTRL
ncbi:VOC family protein [Gemmatimonas aurantiaca]|nr:VOC family protein [Gemmatimonas aurantiaca]